MRKEKISYGDAMKELERIVQKIDGGQVDVDDLAVSVKRAGELIRICRERLKSTQDDIEIALKEMEKETAASADVEDDEEDDDDLFADE